MLLQGLNALFGFFLFLRRAGSDQGFQFPIQAGAVGLGQFHKAEGLEAALSGPHGKQHVRTAADAGDADVEHDGHLDAFVQRVFEREQAAVDRELIHAATDLTSVFEQHQSEDGAAELDARASWSFLHGDGGGHSLASIASGGGGGAGYESQGPRLWSHFRRDGALPRLLWTRAGDAASRVSTGNQW